MTEPAVTLTDMHVKLREALPGDFDTIRDLLTRCGLTTGSVTPDGCTYWIADLDGVPGGCIGLEHGPGVSLIRSTAVVPEARSQGLGRALVTSALTQASLLGNHTVYLFSEEAGEYWRRFGFEPTAPGEIIGALPDAPQVRSGLTKGWIHAEQAWKYVLPSGTLA
ncbi:GNAT family N-acetyltransferase [Deinococcus sp. KSM4-11]|uniref:GNAT family N-acetyltransferase n=1 Tax=Deinococcus sp. KSM4-11 TaxID=2568654 RepID=UPI0010A4695A|nr:GNAT family N-acetyltransferase [Deinococcus sp. KSM4-11]THF85268.1 GNAT family N-acetyltransferase [Deinococcus sp. KSM4-11]